jgi:3-deoxy-D-manno-octulosonic-acid transferase
MYLFYRSIASCFSPLVPLLIRLRLKRGKEDAGRVSERFGKAGYQRPRGMLVWMHAASVGEANAVVPLIEHLLGQFPDLHILLTTVTVTSAALMEKRLPKRALHQFVPVDTLAPVRAFLSHWQPDVALWVDSEFWPNLIVETRKTGAVMGIVNARMSERSYKRWQLLPGFIRKLLAGFTLCFAQSMQDAERLTALGLPRVTGIGNLKYDTPPLPFDAGELARLRQAVANRPVLVAASTHKGEEAMLAEVHRKLANRGLQPLTIIVPRHARRGDAIAGQLPGFRVARRSRGDALTPETEISRRSSSSAARWSGTVARIRSSRRNSEELSSPGRICRILPASWTRCSRKKRLSRCRTRMACRSRRRGCFRTATPAQSWARGRRRMWQNMPALRDPSRSSCSATLRKLVSKVAALYRSLSTCMLRCSGKTRPRFRPRCCRRRRCTVFLPRAGSRLRRR